MREHTKEPWTVYEHPVSNTEEAKRGLAALVDGTPNFITTLFMLEAGGLSPAVTGCGSKSEANARRIAACVNACAGIGTEDLEQPRGMAGAIEPLLCEIQSIKQQRDELLAALKKIKEHCPCDPDINDTWLAAWNAMLDVIAKAEAKEAA